MRRSWRESSRRRRSSTDVPEAIAPGVIDDLRERLERTRLPNAIDGIGWEQGTDLDYLTGLLEYWRDGYDWRRCEQELAAHSEHTIAITEAGPQVLTRRPAASLPIGHAKDVLEA